MSSYPNSPKNDDDLERDKLLNSLLEQTLDLSESERNAYLENHCPDPVLRQEVLELLDEDLGDFLEKPSSDPIPSIGHAGSPLMLVPLCYFGTLAIRRGDFKAARELLEKAEKTQDSTNPTPALPHAILHRSLGKVYQALGLADKAMVQYQKAIRVLESLAPAQVNQRELKQTRFELLQLQGFLDTGQPQSVHDFFA